MQRILAVTHDDNAADHDAFAVEIRLAALQRRAEANTCDIGDANRDTAVTDADHDLFEILNRLDVAAPADELLVAGNLEHTPADIVVGGTHRHGDFLQRNVVGGELVRIHVDLVFLDEATHRGDLGNAFNGLQRIAQIEILQAA